MSSLTSVSASSASSKSSDCSKDVPDYTSGPVRDRGRSIDWFLNRCHALKRDMGEKYDASDIAHQLCQDYMITGAGIRTGSEKKMKKDELGEAMGIHFSKDRFEIAKKDLGDLWPEELTFDDVKRKDFFPGGLEKMKYTKAQKEKIKEKNAGILRPFYTFHRHTNSHLHKPTLPLRSTICGALNGNDSDGGIRLYQSSVG